MNRTDLIERIIELELDMFERVRTAEPALCQEKPETFKSMRAMTHSALSEGTLESYLDDLERAVAEGKNLLTLKYARIERKIPPLKEDPMIGAIVDIEDGWMQQLAERYPHVVKGGPGFGTYLASELETFSDRTLGLYFRDVSEADKAGRNLAEERYDWLFARIGYGSIAEAEERIRRTQAKGG